MKLKNIFSKAYHPIRETLRDYREYARSREPLAERIGSAGYMPFPRLKGFPLPCAEVMSRFEFGKPFSEIVKDARPEIRRKYFGRKEPAEEGE